MDMQHGRLIPAMVAIVLGAMLVGAYLAFAGLDADIGNSATLLAMVVAVFIVPGCASAAVMEWRARRNARVTAPAVAAVPVEARPPFPAAVVVAGIRSLTEARVERRIRERHAVARVLNVPLAMK